VLLPYVASLRLCIFSGFFFYRRLLLLWSGLLQLAVSRVAGVRALFTQLMMIVLARGNIVCAAVLWKTCGFFLPRICVPLLSSDVDHTWHNSSTVAGMQILRRPRSCASSKLSLIVLWCVDGDLDTIYLLICRMCNLECPWRVGGMLRKWKTLWTSKVRT